MGGVHRPVGEEVVEMRRHHAQVVAVACSQLPLFRRRAEVIALHEEHLVSRGARR